jgi:hypothetical protein
MNVSVGLQPVGNISGASTLACTRTGTVSYSIPGVTNASDYVWSINEPQEMGFTAPTLSNGKTTVTFTVNQVSGATNGATLSVTVYSNCFSDAPVTRTMTLYRSSVDASITKGLPSVVCRGGSYSVQAMNGNSMQWTFSYYSNTGLVASQNYTGSNITVNIPNDTRITNMSYMLYYSNVCNGQAGQVGSGAGVSSTGCTPGARLAAQPAEEPAGAYPNPVADVLKIHIPEAASEGGFTAELRDGLQRGTLKGRTAGSSLQLDVRHLPAGLYLLRTVRASGGVSTQKVLIVH